MEHGDGGARVASLWVCVAFCAAVGCVDDGNSAPGLDAGAGVDGGLIGAAGGTVTGDGASVMIPADALDAPVAVEVSVATPGAALPADVEAAGSVFAFTPHGTTFSSPVTLVLPHLGMGGDTLSVLRLQDGDATWEEVVGAVFDVSTVTLETSSFSYYRVVRALSSTVPCGAGLGTLDSATGLCWERTPIETLSTNFDAYSHCIGLGGQWRLPLVDELESLIPAGACPVLADCGIQSSVPVCLNGATCYDANCSTGCTENAGPGPSGCYWGDEYSGLCGPHWTGHILPDDPTSGWLLDFSDATVFSATTAMAAGVTRCVLVE